MRNIEITVQDALSWDDAAREIGISRMTLWRWVKAGKVIAVKLGHYKFIPRSEVDRMKIRARAEGSL